ncbi:MAG: tRNA (N6-isopentenyl adenosine(37)-C2)-methylthiotransferase MiaB [Tissierellia bacterium]|nr:tRNA (N6-isopentenyl adenosine(37)-C2)-methylthiotransferase MiaB [Tissierellia bacterium]
MSKRILRLNETKELYKDVDFISAIKEINDDYYKEKGIKKKALIFTYGCQMNEHNSENMISLLESMNYEMTEDQNEAQLIIFNTCSIRESAENKVIGLLGHMKTLKESKDDLTIAVAGCMMQRDDPRNIILTKYHHVDIIFGTNNIPKLPELIYTQKETGKRVLDIIENYDLVDDIPEYNRLYSHKGFVNIIHGCNNFCTYCIVPYTRGREISRKPEDIVKEITELANNGYKEVTLLGQNVNSYGKNLDRPCSFSELLELINAIPGLERIRFMTPHPKDISDELLEQYGKLDKLSKHLHLPVQSGSDEILKRMNRHYTKEKYISKIEKVKEVYPDIVLSTDIIVGFPGETEEYFEETLDLVKKCKFDFAYTFLYSKRSGTKAAYYEDQIPHDVKLERFNRLLDVLYDIGNEKNTKLIGTEVEVLVDEISKTDDTKVSGRTDGFKLVNFVGTSDLIGKIVKVKITDANTFSLEGELID